MDEHTLTAGHRRWFGAGNHHPPGELMRKHPPRILVAALLVSLVAALGVAVSSAPAAATSVKAFPGAEGFGTDTPGGRGGQVLLVTNLDDSGPGSFRAAVTASGPRIVVFRVSGTILLKRRVDVTSPYLTVAGQTAPGGGITLRMDPAASPCVDKGTMQISTHDVVIRYLRFRPGPTPCADDSHDGLTIYKAGAEDIVIDHASISWAVDENLNTYDYSRRITISNSIISEALSLSTHPQGEHSKGALLGGTGAQDVSLHHNLLVSNKDRNPQISGLSVADIRNNVIYNYGTGSGSGVTLVSSSKGEPRVNWVGNYYKPGPSSDASRPEFAVYSGSTGATWQWYGEGNTRWTSTGDQAARVHSGATGSRVTAPFAVAAVTTSPAAVAYAEVLATAGASYPHRDAVDQRLVASVQDGAGRLVDDPAQVGGYPTLPAGTAPADSDGDGMPDTFEQAHGTNPAVKDAAGDVDGNGYSNIEDWFNGLIGESPSPTTNQAPVVSAGSDQSVRLPSSATLDGTVSDDGLPNPPGAVSTTWSLVSGPATVTFGDASAVDTTASFSVDGTYVLRLTGDDGELSASDEVTVTVNPSGGTTNQAPVVSAGSDQSVTLPASASLDGTVSDDGLPNPPGAVSTTWSLVSGPATGTGTFSPSATVADPSATFSVEGTYVLRLTADDGELSASDEVTVTVLPEGTGGGTAQTTEVRVSAGSDDAEQATGSGKTLLTSGDLELTTDGNAVQVVGVRFAGLQVPKGATVTKAYVQFRTDKVSTGASSMTIRAEKADNTPTYQSTSGNVTSRATTEASVPWSPPAWNTVGEAAAAQRTPDVSALVQAVVSRTGWASGNALAVQFSGTGRRTAEAFEGGASFAPLLHVEYTTG